MTVLLMSCEIDPNNAAIVKIEISTGFRIGDFFKKPRLKKADCLSAPFLDVPNPHSQSHAKNLCF